MKGSRTGLRVEDREVGADAGEEGSGTGPFNKLFGRELSVGEKVHLVQTHRKRYGLNRCCEAVGLSKGTWHRRQQGESRPEDQALKAELRPILREHPDYGYRRIGVELAARLGEPVNHKRGQRILRDNHWSLVRQLPRYRPSGTDPAEVPHDLVSRWAVAWAVGRRRKPRVGVGVLESSPWATEALARRFDELDRSPGPGFCLHQLPLATPATAGGRRASIVFSQRSPW